MASTVPGEGEGSIDAGPSIHTNDTDYAPGALVIIVGHDWRPGEAIELSVNDDEGQSWRHDGTIAADPTGAFQYEVRLPTWFVATYTVRAEGPESGAVLWRFDDSVGTGPSSVAHNGEPPASEVTIATPIANAGRLLLATIAVEGLRPNQAICTPAGWATSAAYRTNRGPSIAMQTFYRVASGAEAVSYTWRLRDRASQCGSATSGILAATGAVGGITAYAGVDVDHPGGPVVTLSAATANGTSVLAPAVNAVPASSIVVRRFANDTASSIAPDATSSTGTANTRVYTIVRQMPGGGPVFPSAASADADQPSAGGTGTLRGSGAASGSWVAQTIVLRAPPVPIVIELTLSDPTAQLGTSLAPDGSASDSTDLVTAIVDGSDPSAGACYAWGGEITVASTEAYDVTVSASAANASLDFLASEPTDYATCTGGEGVAPAMFASASPAGAWVLDQAATTGRSHRYWLGLDVPWTAEPSAALADAELTFVAVADW